MNSIDVAIAVRVKDCEFLSPHDDLDVLYLTSCPLLGV